MPDPKRIPAYTGRPELDGLTLVEKIDALMKEGYGVEDCAVILEINVRDVRHYVFGRRKL